MDRLPIHLLQDVLGLLAKSQHLGSLACFLQCNQFTYAATLPILYCRIELDQTSGYDALFRGVVLPTSTPKEFSRPIASTSCALWPELPLSLDTTNARLQPLVGTEWISEAVYVASTASHRRKLHALAFVQSLTIGVMPSYDLCHRLCLLVRSNKSRLLLPHVLHLEIGDRVVWDLADWQNAISIESRPAVHPFTRFLTYAIRPRFVSVHWPDITVERKSDWWNARYGNREVIDVDDAARKRMLECYWQTFTTRGIERPMTILAQAWKPHCLALRNVSVSRGVAIPGHTTQIAFKPCQCRRKSTTSLCVDHITARERVRNVVSMCGKVVKYGDPRQKTGIELIGMTLGSQREEEEMKLNIVAKLRQRGWTDRFDLAFGS